MQEKCIVFFDVDNTLVNCQTQRLLTIFLWKKGKLSLFFILKIQFWFIFYKIGLIKNVNLIREKSFIKLKGFTIDEFDKLLNEFFNVEIKKRFFLKSLEIIKNHQANNDKVILMSSSIYPLIKIIGSFLNITSISATKLEIKDNRYTGKMYGKVVYGITKKEIAKKIIKNVEGKPFYSYAYTDHCSDIPILKLVNKPIVINPNKSLKTEAINNDWRIMYF